MFVPGAEWVPSNHFDKPYDGSRFPTITEGKLEETGMLGFDLLVPSGSGIYLDSLRTRFVPAVTFRVRKSHNLVGHLGLYKVVEGMPANDADQIGVGMFFDEGGASHLTSLAGPLGDRFYAGAEYGQEDTAHGFLYLKSLHGNDVSRRHLSLVRSGAPTGQNGIIVGVEDISKNGTVFTALKKAVWPIRNGVASPLDNLLRNPSSDLRNRGAVPNG